MVKILQSGWVAAVVGSLLFLGVTAFCWKTPELPKPTGSAAHAERVSGPSWEYYNPEIDQLVADLKKEREAVAEKEKQLNELATRLQAERAEINAVTQAVYRLQQDFDRGVLRLKEEETANLRKLAKTYAAMTPEAAAAVLKELDDAGIAKILVFTKEEETARILEALSKLGEAQSKRVAAISERLRLAVFRQQAEKKKS